MSVKGISIGKGTALHEEQDNDSLEASINGEGFDLNWYRTPYVYLKYDSSSCSCSVLVRQAIELNLNQKQCLRHVLEFYIFFLVIPTNKGDITITKVFCIFSWFFCGRVSSLKMHQGWQKKILLYFPDLIIFLNSWLITPPPVSKSILTSSNFLDIDSLPPFPT